MFSAEILTLFPGMITGYAAESILGKAAAKGLLAITTTDIRDFAPGKHRVTDDAPYGGGAGMVMKVEPLVGAIEAAKTRLPSAPVILLSPRGPTFNQQKARGLAATGSAILVCGRYEGVDERALSVIDEELSLGDFVLTGGELGALIVVDAVARLIPGVLGNADSAVTESFESGLLEHPHYTRPPEWRGQTVPAVLQGGDHAKIAKWRRWHALQLTKARRPDLFAKLELSKQDVKLLAKREDEL
ncbi:MAG: tRNA (guanosine(37)-N1)-methyltransferase TrmD [Archangium sp.]|nr:tRNA (guanosine(37)-N1)-methyltransferase TrmD [Archangium sp.]MDP3155193.1 tRNA (guanosine(37)-N1)-methyltransferase TrmD [Archangium sp.]MDP3573911.1 tRNA (guanosine(37)-N1)-methyltransferase TrmD [Archangium sp.]